MGPKNVTAVGFAPPENFLGRPPFEAEQGFVPSPVATHPEQQRVAPQSLLLATTSSPANWRCPATAPGRAAPIATTPPEGTSCSSRRCPQWHPACTCLHTRTRRSISVAVVEPRHLAFQRELQLVSVLLQCCSVLEPQLSRNPPRVLLHQTEQVTFGAVGAQHVPGEALHSPALLVCDAVSVETHAQRQVVIDAVVGAKVALSSRPPRASPRGRGTTSESWPLQQPSPCTECEPSTRWACRRPSRRLGRHLWPSCLSIGRIDQHTQHRLHPVLQKLMRRGLCRTDPLPLDLRRCEANVHRRGSAQCRVSKQA